MVDGDPVGSTDPEVILWGPQDPEVSRNTIPSPNRHVKGLRASFWRLNAHWCMFWALNAHVMLVSGVERQFQACFWRSAPDCPLCAHPGVKRQDVACFGRSAPERCSVLALNASPCVLQGEKFFSSVFDSVFNFFDFFRDSS